MNGSVSQMTAAELRALADLKEAEAATGPSGEGWGAFSGGTMWGKGRLIVGVSSGRYRAQVDVGGSWVSVENCETADAALDQLAASLDAAAAEIRMAVK